MNKSNAKTAIIIAWRQGEDDLAATVADAERSIGAAGRVLAIEDTTAAGPALTRHRGVEAAEGADVCVIVDAHMRFQGRVLRDIARHVRKSGGLACAQCHHNETCSFDAPHPSGNAYCSGARIVYRASDKGMAPRFTSLCWKWSRESKPGPRACIGGACYAFRRDWYESVGQPLAALSGWGCDEEALSISAWLSGHTPELFDGHVAHRWRARPPWPVPRGEITRQLAGRLALINAVVTEESARRELAEWTRRNDPTVQLPASPELERWRLALLRQPRKWRDWRVQVCEPDEIEGKQRDCPTVTVDRPAQPVHARNPIVTMPGLACTHCHTVHDPARLPVTHSYPNGFRRHSCPACGNFFIVRPPQARAT